jgi:hypothetical protein
VAGETILVPVRGRVADLESMFTLNEVGTAIWRQLVVATSLGRIVERLCAEFEVAPGDAERDAVAFLDRLAALGLVSVPPAPASS